MHYGDCPKKIEARNQTIIGAYESHYGRDQIPGDSQYWTICGRCSYEDGILEQNCELDQVAASGIASFDQMHGVEIDPEIFECNRKVNNGVNWHLGDFYETMVEYSNSNEFKPAIINVDMLLMPKHAASYFSKILMFLSNFDHETMLIANFILEHRHLRSKTVDFVRNLESAACFQCAMQRSRWSFHNEYYWYNGTGKTTTKMSGLIFLKGRSIVN